MLKLGLPAILVLITISSTSHACPDAISQLRQYEKDYQSLGASCPRQEGDIAYVDHLADRRTDCVSTKKELCTAACDSEAVAARCAQLIASNSAASLGSLTGIARHFKDDLTTEQYCMHRLLENCKASQHDQTRSCMVYDEHHFRASEQCQVNLHNLSIQALDLTCQSQDPSVVQQFEQERNQFRDDIEKRIQTTRSVSQSENQNILNARQQCETPANSLSARVSESTVAHRSTATQIQKTEDATATGSPSVITEVYNQKTQQWERRN